MKQLARRINLNLPHAHHDALAAIAKRRGTTVSELVRAGVTKALFVDEVLSQGSHIAVLDKDDTVHPVSSILLGR